MLALHKKPSEKECSIRMGRILMSYVGSEPSDSERGEDVELGIDAVPQSERLVFLRGPSQ